MWVLRWEILWNDPPDGFRNPDPKSAVFALHATADSLSYCSHDIRVCARYRVLPNRNWMREKSTTCQDERSDVEALVAFLGKSEAKTGRLDHSPRTVGGPGGLTGSPTPGEILWTTTLNLGSRAEIVSQYKRMHPNQIHDLEHWLRGSMTRSGGIKQAVIGCFSPSDPLIYVYVERLLKGPYALAIFWDREREQWVIGYVFEGPQHRGTIEDLHRVVESVACSTLNLD
jgi:hypothetical protein